MVETDGGHQRQQRVGDVGGVEPATSPTSSTARSRPSSAKSRKAAPVGFEVRRQMISARLANHALERLGQALVGDRPATDAEPFQNRLEMGRGVEPTR